MIPGEYILADEPISCNVNRKTAVIAVTNSGDRPCQVGSHTHFFEVNKALDFPREKAFGYRLNIPAGTSIRFEPGDTKEVELCEIGGSRIIYGFNGLTMGNTNSMRIKTLALIKARRQGFRGTSYRSLRQEEYKLLSDIVLDVNQNNAASIKQAHEDLDTIYSKIRTPENKAIALDIVSSISRRQFDNITKLIAMAKDSRYMPKERSTFTLKKSRFILEMLEKAVERNIIKDQGKEVFDNDMKKWEEYLGTDLFVKSKKVWI